jgi:hypothetical protein
MKNPQGNLDLHQSQFQNKPPGPQRNPRNQLKALFSEPRHFLAGRFQNSTYHESVLKRMLNLPESNSFFLFGPRQTGKTLLVRTSYPESHLRTYDETGPGGEPSSMASSSKPG